MSQILMLQNEVFPHIIYNHYKGKITTLHYKIAMIRKIKIHIYNISMEGILQESRHSAKKLWHWNIKWIIIANISDLLITKILAIIKSTKTYPHEQILVNIFVFISREQGFSCTTRYNLSFLLVKVQRNLTPRDPTNQQLPHLL